MILAPLHLMKSLDYINLCKIYLKKQKIALLLTGNFIWALKMKILKALIRATY